MRILATLCLVSFLFATSAFSQRLYSTSELELQFSYAAVQDYGDNLVGIPRFSYPNIVHKANLDFGKHFGLFSGLSFRNTGFIYKLNETDKMKHRVLTLGVPLGIKIGRMQRGFYIALGGEMELALNYKEKHFIDGKKDSKFNEWFSNRTDLLNPSFFAGARLNGGESSIYLRYYPQNFFNSGFTVNGEQPSRPYGTMNANLFTLTFAFNLDCNCGCPQSRRRGCCAAPRQPIPVEPQVMPTE